MCDICDLRCIFCSTAIQMHLGDMKTQRDEILVVCSECSLKHVSELLKNRFVLWFCCDMDCSYDPPIFKHEVDAVTVISVTDNAWNNRLINHPNSYIYAPLLEFSPSEGLKTYNNVEEVKNLIARLLTVIFLVNEVLRLKKN